MKFNIKNDKLFKGKGKNSENLIRSWIRFRIEKYVESASNKYPSLKNKNISAHNFRHSVAMNLFQAGIDISAIAIWFGYPNIITRINIWWLILN